MTSDFERQYQDNLASLERGAKIRMRTVGSLSGVSKILRPVFEAVVGVIHESRDVLGDDADEFAEALCLETCFRILESMDMEHVLLDLLLVSRYIAGEAAVAYSMSGVADLLNQEHRIKRIAAAFLGGLSYLLMLNLKMVE